jgi:hypothetical protein
MTLKNALGRRIVFLQLLTDPSEITLCILLYACANRSMLISTRVSVNQVSGKTY